MHRSRVALVALALAGLALTASARVARADVPLSASFHGIVALSTFESTQQYMPGGAIRVLTSLSPAVSVGVEASMIDLGETLHEWRSIPADVESEFFGTMPGHTLLYQMGPVVRVRSKPARARTHFVAGLPIFERSSADEVGTSYGLTLGAGIAGGGSLAPSVEFRWAGFSNRGVGFPDQYVGLAVGLSVR